MADQLHLNIQAAEGMEEAVAWHTTGIVADAGRGIGTGSAISWRGHSLIITAGHVIADSSPEQLWFFFRTAGSLQRVELRDRERRNLPLVLREHIEIHEVFHSREEDIAVIEVPDSLQDGRNIRFYQLHPNQTTPNVDTTVVFMGYPADVALHVGGGNMAVFPSVEWTGITGNIRLDGFDPERHFLLQFQSAADERQPHGFSGAGVWFHRESPVVWYPNLGLAGLCTHYYPGRHLLKSVRVEVLTQFLNNTFPE